MLRLDLGLARLGSLALVLSLGCGDEGGAASSADASSSSDASATQGTSGTETTSSDPTDATTSGVETTGADTTGADTTGADTPLTDEYLLEGDDMFPEGVAFDPTARAFYVGSLTEAGITRVDAEGTQSVFVASGPTMLSSAGMKVDAAARRLWVCGSDDAGSSRVYVYGLDDASLVETFGLGLLIDTASCNDLALDAEGAAYVTDPPSSAIHRLAVGGDASVWATDPLFDPELMSLGLNGIAVTPDGTAVIVTKFISKQLLRVSMDDPTQIAPIDLSGEDFAGGSLVAGPDGIVFEGDTLYVVFDDVVAEVVLNADWTSGAVSILTPPTAGLSTATVAEGEVYAVKSEVTAFALGSAPELPFRIVRVPR
jgi:sugar lactone lactonase YvrE